MFSFSSTRQSPPPPPPFRDSQSSDRIPGLGSLRLNSPKEGECCVYDRGRKGADWFLFWVIPGRAIPPSIGLEFGGGGGGGFLPLRFFPRFHTFRHTFILWEIYRIWLKNSLSRYFLLYWRFVYRIFFIFSIGSINNIIRNRYYINNIGRDRFMRLEYNELNYHRWNEWRDEQVIRDQ